MRVSYAESAPSLWTAAGAAGGARLVTTPRIAAGPVHPLDDAFRAVLKQAARSLTAEGAAPGHLSQAVFHIHSRSEFDEALLDLDLAYREYFAGNFPEITVVEDPSVETIDVAFSALIPPADPGRVVYDGYTQAEIDYQYSPRAQAPDYERVFDVWRTAGPAYQRAHRRAEIFYGDSARQSVDLYLPPEADNPPIHVFVHGGYWQAIDKKNHAHAAAGLLSAGVAVAMPNYDLMPDVDLEEIIRQTRHSVAKIYELAGAYGYDGERLTVSGHSVGGHLAGVLACTEWRRETDGAPDDLIKAALSISGVFDLTPLAQTGMNRVFGFTPDNCRRLSVTSMPPPTALPVTLCVGGKESAEFHRQTTLFGDYMAAQGCPVETVQAPDDDHFTLVEAFGDPATPLGAAAIAMARRA